MANLVSLDDIKTFLQVTGTASDVLLTVYRDSIEAEMGAYCGRTLTENTYTEVVHYLQSPYDANSYTFLDVNYDYPAFVVKNTPITAFELVANGVTVSDTNYWYQDDQGVIQTSSRYDDSKNRLKASYTAGYTTATAPIDLQLVVKEGVRALFTSNTAATSGGASGAVKSKRIKDFSVAFDGSSSYVVQINNSFMKPYLASNSTILNRYKRIGL